MQIKSFERVSYKFSLFDAKNQPVNGLAVILQYFNSSTQVWQEIVRGTMNNGVFLFEEATSPASQLRSLFISDNTVPELRIIPALAVYGFAKQEVLAAVCQVTPNATSVPSVLSFDFGTAYVVDKETLAGSDFYKDFILITSQISQANQTANLELIKSLQADLTACKATNAQLMLTNEKLVTENSALNQKIKSLQSDLAACQSTNKELTSINASLTSENAELRKKIESLNFEIAAKNETIAALNIRLITAQTQIENDELEIARLNAIQVSLEATVADLQRQIEELSRVINFDDRPVAINTLYSNLIREIDTSATNNVNANYKLTNISVKLKALVSTDEDGMNAQLFGLTNTNMVNDSTVSELTFDIAPSVAPAVQTGKLPNLLGLTETAVRRILDSLGLRLNQVIQNNQKVPNGDSFKQSPVEGASFNSNDVVTVIFSKHE